MKNVGDDLARWEKTIGMQEAVCVHFAMLNIQHHKEKSRKNGEIDPTITY